MKLIKINRSTIRKNPDAGQCMFTVPIGRRIEFTCIGELPKELQGCIDKEIRITSEFIDSFNYPQLIISGIVSGDDEFIQTFFRIAKESGRITVTMHQDVQTYWTNPQPEYLYEYANPFITCDECGKKTRVNDIESDCNDYGCYTICSHCGEIDTFEYKYEDIEDIVNTVGHDN